MSQIVDERLLQNIGSVQPLDTKTRNFFEPRSGHDFSQVRVHTDSPSSETARSIDARAFTFGRNIAFGGGGYSPGSHEGKDYWRMSWHMWCSNRAQMELRLSGVPEETITLDAEVDVADQRRRA